MPNTATVWGINNISLLLDTVTSTVWAAWSSFERLKTSYSGSLIQVRDNLGTLADIGYNSSNNLNIAALSGNSPYQIRKVYDQSGNGRDITYTAGAGGSPPTLDTVDVGIRYTDAYLNLPDVSALTAGEGFIAAKLDADPPVAASNGWKMGAGTAAYWPFTDGNMYEDFGSTVRYNGITHTAGSMASRFVYSVWSATNDWGMYLNNTQLSTQSTNTVSFPSAGFLGRSDTGTGGDFLKGRVYSYVLFSQKVTTSERSYLHTNM